MPRPTAAVARTPRARVVARWAGRLIVLLVVESMLLFAGAQLIPGDAASAILGQNATPQTLAILRQQLGLDQSPAVQYWQWITHAMRGDLGTSVQSGQPVTTVMAQPLLDTLILAGFSGVLIVAVSLIVGVAAGSRPGGRVDRLLSAGGLLVVSVPPFVTASVAVIVFAGVLRWLPTASLVPLGGTPLDTPSVLVLPVLSLVLTGTAWASRLVRAAVADATVSPSVEAARLAGLPPHRVMLWHLAPLVAGPCVQTFALMASMLIGGTVVVEQIFAYPGLGQLLVGAVTNHDIPVLEGVGLIMVCAVTLAYSAADLITGLTDARGRTGYR